MIVIGLCTLGKYPLPGVGYRSGGMSAEERLHNKIMMMIMRNSRHTNDQAKEKEDVGVKGGTGSFVDTHSLGAL